MYTTRYSLINRIKDLHDDIAWQEFYDLYCPLIYRYCRQRGLGESDADEIVSRCFESLSRAMSDFEYQPTRGKFKSWLKKMVGNKISDLLGRQREGLLPGSEIEHAAGDQSVEEALWEQSWKNEVLSYCVEQVRAEVSSQNFQVFHLNVREGWSADKVAQSLNMTVEQVYRAKYKVLQKIREKAAVYLEE